MKSILNAILTILLLLYIISTAGCGARHSYATLFDSAECIVDSRPDSVLKILKPINTSLLDNDDKMRYILLLTEAKYKTGDFSDGDSLISIVSRYYDRYIGSIHHLRAYYFQGCMLFRNGNNARAVIAFLNAERSGKIINDSYWLGLIYRGIADAFDAMYDHYSALEYYNLSYEEFMKIPENKYTGYSILDAGRAYFNTFEKDNYVHANKLLRTALEYADRKKDIHLKGHALELLSKCAYELGDFATALELMEEKWNSVPQDFRAKDWHHLGLVYLANGDIEKAKIANDSLKKYAPDMHWLSFEIFNHEGASALLPFP